MSLTATETSLPANPLDLVEEVASGQDWPFDRSADHELDLVLGGAWGDYAISVNWRDDLEALHVAAEIDVKAQSIHRTALIELIALINEQMFLGHFDLWSDEGIILFRHGLLLRGGASVNRAQCEELLTMAVAACDRFYPAFQYVIWAGKPPREALAAALFETQGQA